MSILCTASKPKTLSKFTLTALLSAFLCALPFTFPNFFFVAWFGIMPFFSSLLSQDFFGLKKRKAFATGFLYGFLYCSFIYYWFLWLFPLDFAGLSVPAAVFVIAAAWFGISAFQALSFGIGALLFRLIGKSSPLVLALIFTLCEFSWQLGDLAMPWCKISITQYKFLPFIQSSALLGNLFVSFIIYAVSAFAVCGRKNVKYLIAAAVMFFSNILYGTVMLNIPVSYTDTASFSLVQGNVSSSDKWSASTADSFTLFRTLSEQNAKEHHPDFTVWPESAVPVSIDGAFKSGFLKVSESTDSIFLVGAFGECEGKTSNSLFMIDENGINDVFYSKRHLVPFGEYLPARGFFETFLPFVADINMLSDDLYVGKESGIFTTPFGNIGGLVCFDSIFPSLCTKSVRDGAQLIVLITNDSWYFDSPATSQHAAQAVFRAVENRRCVARCANTGISMLIDEKGRIKTSLGAMEKGVVNGSLGFTSTHTPYTFLGDIAVYIALCYIIILMIRRCIELWKSKESL